MALSLCKHGISSVSRPAVRTLCLCRKYCKQNGSKSLLHDALNCYKEVTMIPFRLESLTFGDSFRNAQLEMIQYMIDRQGTIRDPLWVSARELGRREVGTFAVDFGSLFARGFKALKSYIEDLETDGGFASDPLRLRQTCKILSTFLGKKDFHEECLWSLHEYDLQNSMETESLNSVLIAHHLLSRLAKECHGGYILSRDARVKVYTCPCDNPDCREPIPYGGSGFGSEYLWYGKPDIVVYPAEARGSVNIIFPSKEKYNCVENEEENEKQIDEVKVNSSALRNARNIKQIAAQAVTSSFFQNKFQSKYNHPSTFLIPTIAVCSNSFDIYMYDTKNDILLRNAGDPIPLWSEMHLNMSSVLQLWMVINHLLLRPSLNEDDIDRLRGSCGLKKCLDERRLDLIDETMTMQQDFMSAKISEYKALPYLHHTKANI